MSDPASTPLTPPDRVGFLGLGMMGLPMALQLQRAGFDVAGFDLTAAMAGGPAHLVDWAAAALSAMGKAVFATGPIGSGHAMKALNNYVSAAGLLAACEALRVGRAFGLDPAVMTDVLNASTGRNNSTEVKLKPFVIPGNYTSGFSMALMVKDLLTADDLARALETPAPLSHAVAALWREAGETLDRAADHTAIDLFRPGDAQSA